LIRFYDLYRNVPVNDRFTMYTKMSECRTYAMVNEFIFVSHIRI